VYFQE
jgi:ribonuclease ZC3H12